jgi:hypothetical protein
VDEDDAWTVVWLDIGPVWRRDSYHSVAGKSEGDALEHGDAAHSTGTVGDSNKVQGRSAAAAGGNDEALQRAQHESVQFVVGMFADAHSAALFFVFQNTIEFRGVPFLWLPDISIKDPIYVLPVLVAITAMGLSWIGMKGMKANEQQKIMMYMMPAMMLLFFFNMASGLNLYYLVQNLASLPQQWLIAHERVKASGTPLVRGKPA